MKKIIGSTHMIYSTKKQSETITLKVHGSINKTFLNAKNMLAS